MWTLPSIVITLILGVLLAGAIAPFTLLLPEVTHGPVTLWIVMILSIALVWVLRRPSAGPRGNGSDS